MKLFPASLTSTLTLILSLLAFNASAQIASDEKTQNAILSALPAGVTAETASADEIAQATTNYVFSLEGNLEQNLTQAMVSLGELTKAGKFPHAPRFGDKSPTGRFYLKVMNMAASNLDVSSDTYYSLTVQDMTRLSAAMRTGSNFLNGATNNPITRK